MKVEKVEKVEESKKSNKLKVENVHVGASVVPRGYLLDASSNLYKRVCSYKKIIIFH